MAEEKTISIKNIPNDRWIKFKGVCYLQGKDIRSKFIEMIEKEIQKYEDKSDS